MWNSIKFPDLFSFFKALDYGGMIGAGIGGIVSLIYHRENLTEFIIVGGLIGTGLLGPLLSWADRRFDRLEKLKVMRQIQCDFGNKYYRIFALQEHARLIFGKDSPLVEELLRKEMESPGDGNKANAEDRNSSLLLAAAELGKRTVLERILAQGVNSNVMMDDGTTALMLAAKEEHPDIIEILINAGADVNKKMSDGSTALILAVKNKNTYAAMTLISRGADVNAKMKDGSTPLMLAALHGLPKVVEGLIKKGADVNAKNTDGITPLILAVNEGQASIIEMLLNKDVDISAKMDNGTTALMIAANRNRSDISKLLIDAETVKKKEEKAALPIAEIGTDIAEKDILKDYEAQQTADSSDSVVENVYTPRSKIPQAN